MSELLQAPSRRLLFLIGLRGTGKTCVARLLAEKLGWGWSDADVVLEQRAGRSIRKIFQDEGEAGFRDKEVAVLEDLAARENHVVATGGGVVLRPENRARLGSGTVVWLTAPAEVLWQRLQADSLTAERRPDLGQGGRAEIDELLHGRAPLYDACADCVVDTALRSPEEVADVILRWLEK